LRKGNEEMDDEEIEQSKESLKGLEKILLDLHKLGVIIYFDDKNLKEVVISDPRWFNKVTIFYFNYFFFYCL
jgi:hypothetical protein